MDGPPSRRIATIQGHVGDGLTYVALAPTSSAGRFVDEGNAAIASPASRQWRNWAGNASCTPRRYHEPRNREEIQAVLRAAAAAGEHVTMVGEGHSNNGIMCTEEHMLSLDRCNRVLAVDAATRCVTVEAGVRLKQLNEYLPLHGLALPMLGSIAEQSVAGAMAVATHGTGATHGVLPTWLVAVELILASGDTLHVSEAENADLLPAVRCSLGALGVVYALTLRCCPAYDVTAVETPARLETVLAGLPGLVASAEFVRFWWFPHTEHAVTWVADRAPPGGEHTTPDESPAAAKLAWARDTVLGYHGLEAAYLMAGSAPRLVPLINRAARKLLFDRVKVTTGRSDTVFNFDCLFKQHVNEWAIPAEHAAEAVGRLRDYIASAGLNVHFPVEVRFVAADDIWLSPCYGRDSCYIGIIMYRPFDTDVPSRAYVDAYFDGFEAIMATYNGRPHWSKPHKLGASELAALYPRFGDFLAARNRLDPGHLFSNAYLKARHHAWPYIPPDISFRSASLENDRAVST